MFFLLYVSDPLIASSRINIQKVLTFHVHMIIIQATKQNKPVNKNSSMQAEFEESRRWCDCDNDAHVNGLMRAVESASE